eukprot:RCo050229
MVKGELFIRGRGEGERVRVRMCVCVWGGGSGEKAAFRGTLDGALDIGVAGEAGGVDVSEGVDINLVHVLNHGVAELGRFELLGALHLMGKVKRHLFARDGAVQREQDDIGCAAPAHVPQHHLSAENHRARIDDVQVGEARGSAVGGLKHGMAGEVIDVPPRGNPDASHLGSKGVAEIVPVQVSGRNNVKVLRLHKHVLEHNIRNDVLDQQLLAPLPQPVGGVKSAQGALDLVQDCLLLGRSHHRKPGLHHAGVLLNVVHASVLVADNPALALGDDTIAELPLGQIVGPVLKAPLSELLDVALVHQGDTAAVVLQGVQDRRAYQPLRAGDTDRLNPKRAIRRKGHVPRGRNLQLLRQELPQPSRLLTLGRDFDARVDILDVLPKDHHVHLARVLHRAGHTLEPAHWAKAGVQVELSP